MENQLDRKVKTLRTDRGGEYTSTAFDDICNEKGIEHQFTIPYTPQQNGVAERRNRTLFDMIRSMMSQAQLPISFWGDALLTATYVLNRVPSKSVDTTPYELWTQRKLELSNLRPWGCGAYTHSTDSRYGKLGPRGRKSIFIRYSESSKGYVFVAAEDSGSFVEHESRDVVFLEDEFPRLTDVNQVDDEIELEEVEEQIPENSSGRNNSANRFNEIAVENPVDQSNDDLDSFLNSNLVSLPDAVFPTIPNNQHAGANNQGSGFGMGRVAHSNGSRSIRSSGSIPANNSICA